MTRKETMFLAYAFNCWYSYFEKQALPLYFTWGEYDWDCAAEQLEAEYRGLA